MSTPGDIFRADTTWFHIFHSMIRTRDISDMGPYAVTVYLVIKSHVNFQSGCAFPAIETIMKESGISRSQVMRELKTLEKFGYIGKTRVGRCNEYRLREKICIQDDEGRVAAIATWDYLPSTVKAATAEVKNALESGNFSGSRIVHIEKLQINVTHASGNAVVLNAQDFACLPDELQKLLTSLQHRMREDQDPEVIHRSVRHVSD